MSLFQKSVINKYLKNLDKDKVNNAFDNFKKFYGNKLRLHNIMQLKEENYQEGFLREIFVETLGYTINPDENYNLTTEYKNQKDSRKADGAIIQDGKAIGVIELKSTKTKNLENIKEQAFSYKNNQPGCRYVITSNFQSLRFYVDDATEYEEFNLFELADNTKNDGLTRQFKLFYLLLSKESIFNNLPDKLKKETKFHENDISDKLYKDYKHFKDEIFKNLVKNNPQYDKLSLFKKSQKLLDRFLFVLFAEDGGLIPPNAISKIIEQWKQLQELDEYKPLYSRFQKLFFHLNKGHKYKEWGEIPAYNGGLFREDEILDNPALKIDDEVLLNDSKKLTAYDFNTEVDVNILGHIFEHSLNEIEEITAELQGEKTDKSKSKRKKDGIFYTPKYITKYIVENTVGTLCKEKKEELQIKEIDFGGVYVKTHGRASQHNKLSVKGKKLFKTLNNYKDWLLTLKILDPACGSGAFLNQTLDFLITEHKQVDDIIAELTGETIRLFDTDKAILENNIYGVDINEESVEIAKLSLWLRTAQRGRPLSDLSGNIKCGNSLIDDPEVAGDKAFDWNKEFPQIFKSPDKKKVFQKEIEKEPDYLTLIEKNAKLAQEKAKEAINYSKKVYEYAQKQKSLAEEPRNLYGTNKGGFDVVLGNPPYVRLQGIKANYEQESHFYEKNYVSAISNYDIYVLFIEKSFQLINNTGKVGFILPHKFLISEFGKGVRSYLSENKAVEQLLHFGSEMVFADASTYTCILTLSKNNEKLKFQHLNPLKISEHINFDKLTYKKLDASKWNLNSSDVTNVLDKINRQALRIKDVFSKIFSGIQTSADNVYLIKGKQSSVYVKGYSKSLDRIIEIENDFVKPMIKGDDISKYKDLNNQYFVIFPYILKSGKASPMTEEYIKVYFPLGYNYLKENETFLRGREKGRMDKKGWFLYIYPKSLNECKKKEKIVAPDILYKMNLSFDDKGYCVKNGAYGMILKDEFLYLTKFFLAVLNSNLMWFFLKNTGSELRGGYFRFNTKYIEPFPLPELETISKQNIFIEKANLMLSLNKELQNKSEKFIKRIKANLEVEKITNKLQNFYNFDFKTFVAELKKQKINLNLQQQDEWEDYFDSYKQEINKLQQQINQTDKEIDKMVYELYGLNEEEIEIVEETVKQ